MQRSEPGGVLDVRRARRLRLERSKCTPENQESVHPLAKANGPTPYAQKFARSGNPTGRHGVARTLAASDERTPTTRVVNR